MKQVVSGIVLVESKILLVKNKHLEKPDNKFWSLPGGGVEEGESLEQALKREMLEETGVKPEIGPLLFINEYRNEAGKFLPPNFIFLINNPQDFANADFSVASHSFELADIKFFDLNTEEEIKPPWLLKKLIHHPNDCGTNLISEDYKK